MLENNKLAAIFKNIRPGKGSIIFEKDTRKERARKRREYETIKKILKDYGGNFMILAESKVQGVSRLDALRDRTELIEIKHPTSLTAINSRLKDALIQTLHEKLDNRDQKYQKIVIFDTKNFLKNSSEKTICSKIIERLEKTNRIEIDQIIIYADKRKIILSPQDYL